MRSFFEAFNNEIEAEIDSLEPEIEEEIAEVNELQQKAEAVMEAYQNANKWLDIIKEFLFTDLGCVFFSSYIHDLAHTMPVRFDKFGDILHTIDMKVPYPATSYIPQEPTTVDEALTCTFEILDAIKLALNDFIKYTDDEFHGMACSAETLLNDIEGEYVPLFKMEKAWQDYQDIMRFDKWVGQYVEKRSELNESLNEASHSQTYNERVKDLSPDKLQHIIDVNKTRESCNWEPEPRNVQLDYEKRFQKEIDAYNIKHYGFTW